MLIGDLSAPLLANLLRSYNASCSRCTDLVVREIPPYFVLRIADPKSVAQSYESFIMISLPSETYGSIKLRLKVF